MDKQEKMKRLQILQTAYVLLKHYLSKTPIGYVNGKVDKMANDFKIRDRFSQVEKEFKELIGDITIDEMKEYNSKSENKITYQKQRDIAEEYLGESVTVEDYLNS